jgi:hypothetical protein
MNRMMCACALLLSVALIWNGHLATAGGGKKDEPKGGGKKEEAKPGKDKDKHKDKDNKKDAGKHPHIEKALSHLHEAREAVIAAIRAEEKERKIDGTVQRELVKSMDDVNQAIAHARSALGLEGGKR